MEKEELAPHIEELKKALGNKVSEDIIAKDLNEYVNVFHIPLESAKRSVCMKYGSDTTPFVTGANVVKKIGDLTGSEMSVDIVARVLFLKEKTIQGKNGERNIISGILGDETGSASFTDWSGNKEIVKGKVYRFKNCYTKTWNENVQINIGNKSTIETSDEDIKVKDREFTPVETVTRKIGDLEGDEKSVDITARVVFSDLKNRPTKEGNDRYIISGILGDETGTASFTLWNDSPVLEKGKVYKFRNCYVRTWNDNVQINIGNNGSIEETDEVIDNVPMRQRPVTSSEMKISDIKENSGNVTVVGRILSVSVKEIKTKTGELRTVYSGTMCDDTGEIQFSAWNDFGLEADKSYRISNAYIRGWNGIPQLNIGDKSEVSMVDIAFDTSKIGLGSERTIGDIVKNRGGLDVIVRGVVVDIRPGSGIIKRCPDCKRTIINDVCQIHGPVEPMPDLRMKIIIDDGTGSIATTMNREATERFTGVTFDAAFSLSKARGEDIVVKDLGDRLYMKHLKVRGNAMTDDFGAKINAKDITADDVDVKKGAKELLDEVEGML